MNFCEVFDAVGIEMTIYRSKVCNWYSSFEPVNTACSAVKDVDLPSQGVYIGDRFIAFFALKSLRRIELCPLLLPLQPCVDRPA